VAESRRRYRHLPCARVRLALDRLPRQPGIRLHHRYAPDRVGSWGGFNDRDAFRITAPAGSKLTATLAITGGQYIARYAVVSKAGTVLTQGITGLTGATRFRRTWSFTLPSSGGPWYLTTTATSASRRGRGTYTLSLR
jgi:hypothetical protein